MEWKPIEVKRERMWPDAVWSMEEQMWLIVCWATLLGEPYLDIYHEYKAKQKTWALEQTKKLKEEA
jgi:hypothetical protein